MHLNTHKTDIFMLYYATINCIRVTFQFLTSLRFYHILFSTLRRFLIYFPLIFSCFFRSFSSISSILLALVKTLPEDFGLVATGYLVFCWCRRSIKIYLLRQLAPFTGIIHLFQTGVRGLLLSGLRIETLHSDDSEKDLLLLISVCELSIVVSSSVSQSSNII